MINKGFFEAAEELAAARGITVQDVYDTFEKGLINSFKKMNGNTSCRVVINPDRNEILMYAIYKVVEKVEAADEVLEDELEVEAEENSIAEISLEDAKKMKASAKIGDVIETKVDMANFSRTIIGVLKNVYQQGLRDAQRNAAYEHFVQLEGEMITGDVVQVKEKFVTISLGMNVTTSLPKTELLANDNFGEGDKIRVYIKKVEKTTKDPKVLVSRTDRNLVTRLMEDFIPEIKDGTIQIKGIARDPGDRSKIALFSTNDSVDAIGSCVGEGGSRIKAIVNALGGEKVDLYKWSEDPEELIKNSLQPADVTTVLSVDVKEKTSKVVVRDDQLSLAIGKSGQNVRLAVQSCGWKIDIMPLSEAYEKGLVLNIETK